MSVHTQRNNLLFVEIDGKRYDCQIIDLQFTFPKDGDPTITQTACPDGTVSEPGEKTPGSLTGTVFTDTSTAGLTTALIQALNTSKEFPYDLVWWPDVSGSALQITGNARVSDLTLEWSKPGVAKHTLALSIITATVTPFTAPAITGLTAPTGGAMSWTITPATAVPPADLTTLKADAVIGDAGSAKPAAFTAGQYLVLADGSRVHYSGTAWVAGAAK